MAVWASPSDARLRPSFESSWEAMMAPPTEPLAAVTARAGSAGARVAASRLEYSDAATLPMMATPSVPPKSRVASFIAEPTPDLALGTAPMIASVAGRAGEAHTGAEEEHLEDNDRVGGRRRRLSRSITSPAANETSPAVTIDLVADPHGELRPDDRGDGHGTRDRQEPYSGAEGGEGP